MSTTIKKRPFIHPEGWKFATIFFVISIIISMLWLPLAAIGFLLTLFTLWFFRDPERHTPEDPNLVISSADGKVCLIDEACPPEELLIENESNWNERPWEVIIYLMGDDYTLDNMDSITEYRNEVQNTCEYLWSHPSFSKGGNNQAPNRIIIQQDRARLMELRNGKKKENSKKETSANKSNIIR